MGRWQNIERVAETRLFVDEELAEHLTTYYSEEDKIKQQQKSWITTKNRLIIVTEIEMPVYELFRTRDYEYAVQEYDLNKMDPRQISKNIISDGGFFFRFDKSCLILRIPVDGITKEVKLMHQVDNVDYIYDNLMKNYNKYKIKEINAGSTSSISEIRRLYEDNIITKQEMLDLIAKIAK